MINNNWGGIWGRMIDVIRRMMPAIMPITRLTDEIPETVESMINSRPLAN